MTDEDLRIAEIAKELTIAIWQDTNPRARGNLQNALAQQYPNDTTIKTYPLPTQEYEFVLEQVRDTLQRMRDPE